MAKISVDGRSIAYEESGAGEPLILIHGGLSDRVQYDVFRPLLGEGIRAIAYDQRDTRDNPQTDGAAYRIRDLAADCAAFIRSLGLEKAHVLGHSYGGTIAMTTAIHFPDVVQSLILAGTTPSHTMTTATVAGVTASNARMTPAAAGSGVDRDDTPMDDFLLPRGITPEAMARNPDLVAEVKAVIRPGTPEAVARRMAATASHDCRDDLHRIAAPTLVLHGERDDLVPVSAAVWIAGHVKDAELIVLPDAGHSLTIQHRDVVAPIVRAFVLKHPLRAPVAPRR